MENGTDIENDTDNPNLFSCPDNNHPHAIDLGLPSGTKWACCNVGASSPENAGKYYAWGETEQKGVNAYTESGYSLYNWAHGYTYITDIAKTKNDVAHVKMGGTWCMPNKEQQEELINNCSRKWTYYNGIFGVVVTGKNGSQIFLPAASDRYTANAAPMNENNYGNYWSSSIYSDEDRYAYHLVFASNFWDCMAGRGWGRRYEGYSVRAVCP